MKRIGFRATSLLVPLLLGLSSAACGHVRVEGDAMAPTLADGDRVAVTRAVEPLNRGDIVVFEHPRDPSKMFLKRIVGLPGEQIEITDRGVAIEGRLLDEPYVLAANRSTSHWGPARIQDGEYFVLGDNRRNSSDSRHWGTVRRALIRSKVPGR
jgi:signal peptidase I